MAIIDGLLQEFEQESHATRRVLERVPDDQLAWRPHPKGRSLGELAFHVASLPGSIATIASQLEIQAPDFTEQTVRSASELVPMLDGGIAKVKTLLGGMDDAALAQIWRLKQGDREIFAVPRAALLRSLLLNHWYHHRGQLSVYLRALGQPVPSIYGPSADENPFAV